jgi:type IV pilus assembly protein PilB
MSNWSVSRDAHLALCKILLKSGAAPENSFSAESAVPEMLKEGCGPVLWCARKGIIAEHDALSALAKKLGIPLVALDRKTKNLASTLLKSEELKGVPVDCWTGLKAIPVELNPRHVLVAFANPLDHAAAKTLQHLSGLSVRPALAGEEAILEVLGAWGTFSSNEDLASIVKQHDSPLTLASENSSDVGNFEATLSSSDLTDPPIIRLVNKILADGVQARASDIHVTPEKDTMSVKVRIDGILQPLFSVPSNAQNPVISRLKLLAGMDISERRRPQDGRMRIKSTSGAKDLRVSTVPTAFGESVVIRVLSTDLSRLTIEALGADAESQHMIAQSLKSSSRVVLVTGPTGSGKTSTLYACLLALKDGSNNLITIEDPVEYKIEGINQIQVNPKVGVTFADGLRSILRQDPDVIMVGEIRDGETASIAMQAAQTGHLVLSTIHTNSAASAVTRLRDLGLPPYVIASSVGTIIAQRLVRKLCPHCAAPGAQIDQAILSRLRVDPEKVKHAVGCEQCSGVGYAGRTGLFSILEITEPVRAAIRDGRSEAEVEGLARGFGFKSLLESAVQAVEEGRTTLEEVERCLGSLELLSQGSGNASFGQPSANSPASGLSKRKVLLVEDDENTRLVLSLLLKREMFEVVEASDGFEALDRVYEAPPELIVCDLMMPRMGGLEFVQLLRKDKRASSIPVLMLTAADAEQNELTSLTSGADDFVSKTADSRVMLARVHRLLGRSNQ